MSAKILTVDIETMPAIIEKFDLYPSYTPIDMVIEPTRVLCFAAKWYDKKKVEFHAAWEDGDEDAFQSMAEAAWNLFDQADVVIGWNSDRFDIQYFNSVFGRLQLGPPSPYRSLDLLKVARKQFGKGEMSKKLDWYSRQWLGDQKVKHDGIALWQQIRRGTPEEKAKAQRTMQKYNIKDVKLTEQLFDRFRPWTGVNFALFDEDQYENGRLVRCTHCGSDKLQSRGTFRNTTYAYERYYCTSCKGWNRGRKMVYTTELRPV